MHEIQYTGHRLRPVSLKDNLNSWIDKKEDLGFSW